MNEYEQELKSALLAVRQASHVCRKIQAAIEPEAMEKRDKSPVTIADYASQALICRQLQIDFADDPVIGEEGSDELREGENAQFLSRVTATLADVGVTADGNEVCQWIDRGNLQDYRPRFWTLDPIDGTKGFLRKQQYAISLALIVDGSIKMGVLGCPNLPSTDGQSTGVLAWAVDGQQAWARSLDDEGAKPIPLSVTETNDTTSARFCESVESSHSAHGWSGQIAAELGITAEPYRIDSQCKYLAVARGDADIYLRLPTQKGYQEKIWDHAGGVKVVLESGGKVTDIHGQPLDFRQGSTLAKNQGVVVSNGRLHDSVMAAVRAHVPTSR